MITGCASFGFRHPQQAFSEPFGGTRDVRTSAAVERKKAPAEAGAFLTSRAGAFPRSQERKSRSQRPGFNFRPKGRRSEVIAQLRLIGCRNESVLVGAEQGGGQFGTLALSGQLVARSTQLEERKTPKSENPIGLFGNEMCRWRRFFARAMTSPKSNYRTRSGLQQTMSIALRG